uniref:uncharacterized protein LOC705269 n=1 Tax=Macaca mulatta TaxID=9544 RepID=UPI0010A2621C|nr:uncharacterized protein LOC705269 [Macaca mulatta]
MKAHNLQPLAVVFLKTRKGTEPWLKIPESCNPQREYFREGWPFPPGNRSVQAAGRSCGEGATVMQRHQADFLLARGRRCPYPVLYCGSPDYSGPPKRSGGVCARSAPARQAQLSAQPRPARPLDTPSSGVGRGSKGRVFFPDSSGKTRKGGGGCVNWARGKASGNKRGSERTAAEVLRAPLGPPRIPVNHPHPGRAPEMMKMQIHGLHSSPTVSPTVSGITQESAFSTSARADGASKVWEQLLHTQQVRYHQGSTATAAAAVSTAGLRLNRPWSFPLVPPRCSARIGGGVQIWR